MKILSISVIKDEADIIALSLSKALEWSDKIFVLDNGSTDNTWEIVKDLSEQDPRIVPWKKFDVPFYEGLRAEVFNEFRTIAEEGDWWCFRLDADEFYIDNPKHFLQNISKRHHYVCKDSIEYYLTFKDLEELNFKENFSSLINKIKYYDKFTYREARFFRHRNRLDWNPKDPFPKHMGIVSNKLIRAKHYQYRSIDQIQRRLEVRREAIKNGFPGWEHASQEDYNKKLRFRSELIYDKQDGTFHTEGFNNDINHSFPKLVAKHILHGLGILP